MKRIFFRTINYAIFNFNLSTQKRKIFNRFNETSVPQRDIKNLFIVTTLFFFLLASIFKGEFFILFLIGCIIFFINNIKLLLYIKKNLDFLSMIKSYFIELIIIFIKTISIIVSFILVYILRQNKLKI